MFSECEVCQRVSGLVTYEQDDVIVCLDVIDVNELPVDYNESDA